MPQFCKRRCPHNDREKRIIVTQKRNPTRIASVNALDSIEKFCYENEIRYFCDFVDICSESDNPELQSWFERITKSNAFLRGVRARIAVANRRRKADLNRTNNTPP